MSKPRATKPTGKSTGQASAGTPPSGAGKAAPKDKGAAPEKAPKEAAPEKARKERTPDPTRYGDWEKKGRCIDF